MAEPAPNDPLVPLRNNINGSLDQLRGLADWYYVRSMSDRKWDARLRIAGVVFAALATIGSGVTAGLPHPEISIISAICAGTSVAIYSACGILRLNDDAARRMSAHADCVDAVTERWAEALEAELIPDLDARFRALHDVWIKANRDVARLQREQAALAAAALRQRSHTGPPQIGTTS